MPKNQSRGCADGRKEGDHTNKENARTLTFEI